VQIYYFSLSSGLVCRSHLEICTWTIRNHFLPPRPFCGRHTFRRRPIFRFQILDPGRHPVSSAQPVDAATMQSFSRTSKVIRFPAFFNRIRLTKQSPGWVMGCGFEPQQPFIGGVLIMMSRMAPIPPILSLCTRMGIAPSLLSP